LIVSTLGLEESLVGLVVVVAIVAVTRQSRRLFDGVRLSLKALFLAPIYLLYFLWQLIKANLDVAMRVLSPSLPINPGIVRVRTGLKSSLGKLVLANSITLTPGTLTLDSEGDSLYIHWINVKGEDVYSATNAVVAGFERILKGIVE
jgi:multicomponent Na+:H+ antiporter subunit E